MQVFSRSLLGEVGSQLHWDCETSTEYFQEFSSQRTGSWSGPHPLTTVLNAAKKLLMVSVFRSSTPERLNGTPAGLEKAGRVFKLQA